MKHTWGTSVGRVVSYPAMLAVSLASIVFLFATTRNTVADPDIWWHLRDADSMVRTGSLAQVDVYSFTVAGRQWIDSEWLSELPFWLAWRCGGERGLFFLTVLLMQGIVFGIYYLAWLRVRDIKASFFASLFGFLLAMVSFSPRPLLFGWILFIAELIVLQKWREGKGCLWVLPLLFALWVNMHGSWLIGLTYLAIFAVCGCWGHSWGQIACARWPQKQAGQIAWVSAASVGALFVNPSGWRAVYLPFDMAFGEKINTVVNQEWHSIDFHDARGQVVFGILAFLVIVTLVRRRTWMLWDLAFLIVAVYAAFAHVRFLFMLGIVACPYLAKEWMVFSPYRADRDRPGLNAVVVLGLVVLCVIRVPGRAQLQRDICGGSDGMPVLALKYLEKNPPHGRVLNDINWGGYMTWYAPQIPVFADSRDDIFEHCGILADYMSILEMRSPLEMLDKYRIRYVLFAKDAPLVYLLRNSSQWKVDHEDATAVLFERRDSALIASR